MKKIAIASDHAGVSLKSEIVNLLKQKEIEVIDFGPSTTDRVDYPDFASQVAKSVSEKTVDGGILICGTGIGMALAANKFKDVRAASIVDEFSCQMTREHNNLNVLCLGERVIGAGKAFNLVEIFLNTDFAGGRHEGRVQKITDLENQNFKN